MPKSPSIGELMAQWERCTRLSRMCTDAETARTLQTVAEEYVAQARLVEQSQLLSHDHPGVRDNSEQHDVMSRDTLRLPQTRQRGGVR